MAPGTIRHGPRPVAPRVQQGKPAVADLQGGPARVRHDSANKRRAVGHGRALAVSQAEIGLAVQQGALHSQLLLCPGVVHQITLHHLLPADNDLLCKRLGRCSRAQGKQRVPYGLAGQISADAGAEVLHAAVSVRHGGHDPAIAGEHQVCVLSGQIPVPVRAALNGYVPGRPAHGGLYPSKRLEKKPSSPLNMLGICCAALPVDMTEVCTSEARTAMN